MKERFVVGRKWNSPVIYTYATSEKIEMQIDLADFINALVEEAGSPALTMTKAGLKAKLLEAAEKVVSEVKTASREVT
jgi:hypothetical protein